MATAHNQDAIKTKVYFDIEIGGQPAGSLLHIHANVTPSCLVVDADMLAQNELLMSQSAHMLRT